MEHCYGCGIGTQQHPIVAIMKNAISETPKLRISMDRQWMAVAICSPCHVDPSHRLQTVKGSFFPRQDATIALRSAEMQIMREPK